MAEITIEEVWQSEKIKYSFPEGLQLKTVQTEDLNVICSLPYFISAHLLGRLMFHSSIIISSNW